MLIDGASVGSVSGRVLEVENPAKRRPIVEIPRGEEAARTIALEAGKALRTQARPEARLGADIFRDFGGAQHKNVQECYCEPRHAPTAIGGDP